MEKIKIRCSFCSSYKTVRNGYYANGIQRYKCKDCGKLFAEEKKVDVEKEYNRRNLLLDYYISDIISNKKSRADAKLSARKLADKYNISPTTASSWIKDYENDEALQKEISGYFENPDKWEQYVEAYKKSRI